MIKLRSTLSLKLIVAFLFMSASMNSQITLMPLFQDSEFLVLDQIFSVNILNPTASTIEGFIEVNIEDRQSGELVLKINSPLTSLSPGITNSQQINWGNTIDFGTSQLLNSVGATGRFSNGDYLFCYNFLSKQNNQNLGSNCYERSIRIAGVPRLISPYDNETIDSKNPVLTWRPPLPSYSTNVVYSLKLAPIYKKQSNIEAITKNFSQIELSQIDRTFQIYPADAIALEPGRNYVWQVTAIQNGFEIGATEIWKFRLKENEFRRAGEIEESYRFVKTRKDASYYLANKDIYFAYDNKYNEQELNYEIKSHNNTNILSDALPTINLEKGLNKIIINAELIDGLKDEEKYTLVIKAKNRKKYYFNFLYLNK